MNTKKLKELVLDLAIHGKLVPQDPNDEPASVLLERIRNEKERLVKESKIKKSKSTTSSDTPPYENVPFDVPNGWCWCRLSDVGEIVTGNTPSKEHSEYYGGEIPFFKPTDLEQGINTIYASDMLTDLGYGISRKLTEGSILVTCIGATIGKTGVIRKHGTCNQQINAIIPNKSVISEYCYYSIISGYFQSEIKDNANATTLPILNKRSFSELLFPLPPLAEQQRIVTEIERWFSVIDALEANEGDLLKTIDQAKKKILDLAIRGKFVPQDPNDEPAGELLKKLGVSSDNRPYENVPFEVPNGWCMCLLNSVSDVARGGSPRPIKSYLTTDDNGVNWIKIGDATSGSKYIETTAERIKPEGAAHSRFVKEGDFLLTNSMSFGKPYILKTNGCIHDGWLVISPFNGTYNKDFLYYLISSNYAYNQFSDKAEGAVVSNLNKDKVASSVFPLPPLAEQKRIVDKVEELFSQLDTIAKALE